MTYALDPAVIADARRRQRRRRNRLVVLTLLIALAAAITLTIIQRPPGAGSGPNTSALRESARTHPASPQPRLLPGYHIYSYAQAAARGLLRPSDLYQAKYDPKVCVPSKTWSCTGPKMYCLNNGQTDGGYPTLAALNAAIKKAPPNAVCTTDPRTTGTGAGSTRTYAALQAQPSGGGNLTYLDLDAGLFITYPSRFHARHFTISADDPPIQGITIANFKPLPDFDFQTETGQPETAPTNGVILQLITSAPTDLPVSVPKTPLPLSLTDFPPGTQSQQAPMETSELSLGLSNTRMTAIVLIGNNASANDEHAIANIIASIR